MSELTTMYNPDTFIREVVSDRYIHIQDIYGNTTATIDYLQFSSALVNGRFVDVIKVDESITKYQFTNSDKSIQGLNNLLTVIGQLKNGSYIAPSIIEAQPIVDDTVDFSIIYDKDSFIKDVQDGFNIRVQDNSGAIRYIIDYNDVTSTVLQNRFVIIYEPKTTLQFISIEEATVALNSFRTLVDQLVDDTYTTPTTSTASIYETSGDSVIYNPNTIIREVLNDRYIQLQDTYGNSTSTIDIQEFVSSLVNGRFVDIIKSNDIILRLQFVSSDKAIQGMDSLLTVIGQLKNGTYIVPTSGVQTPSVDETVDYSILFQSNNFIKQVIGALIQIQDSEAFAVQYSINYNGVTTTMVNNRFLTIYMPGNTPNQTQLQFLTTEDALLALTLLRTTIDQLKDVTYNYTNANLTDDLYDPDTFIVTIEIDDFSVQLRNTKNSITHTIVASQETTIYTKENFVYVKAEATDQLIELRFETSEKAIEGAEKLILAIRQIVDRSTVPSGDFTMKSYSEIFASQSTWKLNPDIDFDITSAQLQYYEYVCIDGGICADIDRVKQECEGLVEFVGSDTTGILDCVNIYFNKPISGRATLISK